MANGASAALKSEPSIAHVLGGLRMLVAQLRLYQKTSPQVAKVGTTAAQSILDMLEIRRELTFASAAEGLLVNAARFPAEDPVMVVLEASILTLLREASVKSFTFRNGITR